jgi:hypothetical protein
MALRTSISFTEDDLARAAAFAHKSAESTFNRRGVSRTEHERNARVGKLGEIAFARFLTAHGKALLGTDDMFTVWDDTYTVDKMDFETADGKTIDIKTASARHHTRILVPHDQFHSQPKNFYVGVRISEDEKTAAVIGFADRKELQPFGGGDYPAYARKLDALRPISTLLEMIPDSDENPCHE